MTTKTDEMSPPRGGNPRVKLPYEQRVALSERGGHEFTSLRDVPQIDPAAEHFPVALCVRSCSFHFPGIPQPHALFGGDLIVTRERVAVASRLPDHFVILRFLDRDHFERWQKYRDARVERLTAEAGELGFDLIASGKIHMKDATDERELSRAGRLLTPHKHRHLIHVEAHRGPQIH